MNEFLGKYNESKKVRDLIKHKVFQSKHIHTTSTYHSYRNHDLTFKITHIKQSNKYYNDVLVNVKVSGKIRGGWWRSDENGMCDITSGGFTNTIQRNRDIRNYVENSVKHYLILFGLHKHNIEIGKVAVCDSL